MKTIMAIVLVSLLGFLGCSGSDDDTNTIGEATPAAPFGVTDTPTPIYEWTPVPGATKYRLLVQDTSGTGVIEEWYTAEEGGCASEDGLCMVTPDTEVIGENAWKVLACVGEVCGLWSDELLFSFLSAKRPPRFTDNGDETVTDNNTGLMWTRSANPAGTLNTWSPAATYCKSLRFPAPPDFLSYNDWKLPIIADLRSLIVGREHHPALPPGHPFVDVPATGAYWTYPCKRHTDKSQCYSYGGLITTGLFERYYQDATLFAWCVRQAAD